MCELLIVYNHLMALLLEDIQRRRSEVASSLSAAQTKLGVLESQISSLSSSLGYTTVPSESQLRSDLAALDREIASSESLLSAAESEMSSWLSKYDALRGGSTGSSPSSSPSVPSSSVSGSGPSGVVPPSFSGTVPSGSGSLPDFADDELA